MVWPSEKKYNIWYGTQALYSVYAVRWGGGGGTEALYAVRCPGKGAVATTCVWEDACRDRKSVV